MAQNTARLISMKIKTNCLKMPRAQNIIINLNRGRDCIKCKYQKVNKMHKD